MALRSNISCPTPSGSYGGAASVYRHRAIHWREGTAAHFTKYFILYHRQGICSLKAENGPSYLVSCLSHWSRLGISKGGRNLHKASKPAQWPQRKLFLPDSDWGSLPIAACISLCSEAWGLKSQIPFILPSRIAASSFFHRKISFLFLKLTLIIFYHSVPQVELT